MVRYDYTDTKKIMVFIGLQVYLCYIFLLSVHQFINIFHFQAPICKIKCLTSKKYTSIQKEV